METTILRILKDALKGVYDLTTASYIQLVEHVVANVGLQRNNRISTHTRVMNNVGGDTYLSNGNSTIRVKNTVDINDRVHTLRSAINWLEPLHTLYRTMGVLPKHRTVKALNRFNRLVHLQHKKELFYVANWTKLQSRAMSQNMRFDIRTVIYNATDARAKNKRKNSKLMNIIILDYKPYEIASIKTFVSLSMSVRRYYDEGGIIYLGNTPVLGLNQLFTLSENVFVGSHYDAVGYEGLKTVTFGKYTKWNRDALAWIETLNPDIEYYRLLDEGTIPDDADFEYHNAERETFIPEDEDTYGLTPEEREVYFTEKETKEENILTGKDNDIYEIAHARNQQLGIKMYYITESGVKLSLKAFIACHGEELAEVNLTADDLAAIASIVGVDVEDDR